MGVGSIGIIDNDTVDISNLHRQILYTPKDIGAYKSQIAALKMREHNPFIEVQFFTDKLNRENINSIFKNYEIIVDCTDNFETKFLVHDTCYLQSKILVQASIYQFEGHLHVFDFSKNEKLELAPCLRCLWTTEPLDGCIGTCADVGVLGATVGVLGSLQAMEVAKLILGKKTLKNGEGLFVDLLTQDYEKRKWKKNSECPFCSIKGQNSHLDEISGIVADYKLSFSELSDDFVWVDLRSEEESKLFFIDHPGVVHMPLSIFDISKLDSSHKYLLICQKGFRSSQVARSLHEMGHTNIFSLIDGIQILKAH